MEIPARIGPYPVVREVARGGMGVVYEARHPTLGTPLAVKVVLAADPDPEATARFVTEARACATLRHPNVLRVVDTGTERGRPWLAMDLLHGESLAARLRRSGPLDPLEAARIAAALARALEHVHAHGLLHRDLKPENVVMEGDRPVLVDFGLARDARRERERLTKTGQILGTPGYMSPEQANGESNRVDARADVYGLGATLHALLTGLAPFTGDQPMAVMMRVLTEPARPPSSSREGIDPALDAIVLRCLAKTREERFPNAAALAAALEGWLAGSAPARGPGRFPALIAAGLLASAGLTAALIVRPRETPPLTPQPAPPPPGTTQVTRDVVAELGRARELLARRAWDDALAATASLVAELPRDAAAWTLRGEVLTLHTRYRPGDPAAALAALQTACGLAPTSAEAAALLALACRACEDREGLAAEAGRALDLDATSALAHVAEATRLEWEALQHGAQQALPDDLEAGLRAAIERARDPGAASPWLQHVRCKAAFALARAMAIRPEACTDEHLAALAILPDDPWLLASTGWWLKHEAEVPGCPPARAQAVLTQALELHDRAIELDPDYWYAYMERGWAYHLRWTRTGANEDRERTWTDLDRAAELNPAHFQPVWVGVIVARSTKETERLVGGLIETLRRVPDHPEARELVEALNPSLRARVRQAVSEGRPSAAPR